MTHEPHVPVEHVLSKSLEIDGQVLSDTGENLSLLCSIEWSKDPLTVLKNENERSSRQFFVVDRPL